MEEKMLLDKKVLMDLSHDQIDKWIGELNNRKQLFESGHQFMEFVNMVFSNIICNIAFSLCIDGQEKGALDQIVGNIQTTTDAMYKEKLKKDSANDDHIHH